MWLVPLSHKEVWEARLSRFGIVQETLSSRVWRRLGCYSGEFGLGSTWRLGRVLNL